MKTGWSAGKLRRQSAFLATGREKYAEMRLDQALTAEQGLPLAEATCCGIQLVKFAPPRKLYTDIRSVAGPEQANPLCGFTTGTPAKPGFLRRDVKKYAQITHKKNSHLKTGFFCDFLRSE
jgi:hypothetical protein